MRPALLACLVLLVLPAVATSDRCCGRYSGSFSFDRDIDETRTSGDTTYRLVRSDHWTVTLGQRILDTEHEQESSNALYHATITGTVDVYYTQQSGSDPSETATGHWEGSGPVRVSINEIRTDQNGVRLSDLTIEGDNYSGTEGLPGQWTEPNNGFNEPQTHHDPFIPQLDAEIAPGEPTARTTDSSPANSWSSFRVTQFQENDWTGTSALANTANLRYTPPEDTGDDPPPNRPPIARSDHWSVAAGDYVYDNALKNDSDPDGDRFTPRVTSISFRASEWSGMERKGTFNYVSGPGTRVHQRKVITYHLVDSKGARSAPAKVTIDVIPPGKRKRSPIRNRRGRRASTAAAARWYKHRSAIRSCFGTGFDSFCFGVYSPKQVQAVNAATPWVSPPTSGEARRACALAFSRAGVAGCVAKLVGGGLLRAGDKQIIRTAASDGAYCLLYRVDLNRTASHPLAGEWSKPDFHPIYYLVKGGEWAKWKKWQVPMSCGRDSSSRSPTYYAWARWYENLVVR